MATQLSTFSTGLWPLASLLLLQLLPCFADQFVTYQALCRAVSLTCHTLLPTQPPVVALQGDLFKKLLRSGGSLEEHYVARQVLLPLVLTLEHLHARRIYHRDIKPENIFLTRDGRFKLGDFGCVCVCYM